MAMKYLAGFSLLVMTVFISCGPAEEKTTESSAGAAKVLTGAQVFNNNCYQCHSLDQAKIGPPLSGVFAKWDNDTSRIAAFIRNSKESIHNADPRALQVAEEWNNALMTPMPHLTDKDIDLLLEYMAAGKD